MKSNRLLSALMLLQAHGRLSSREISERLEVSQRTAHRDMEALCEAGVPLIALRGVQGGWELQKGWRTKIPGLDEAELQALLMAQPSALGDSKLAAAAERAFDKLTASMPAAMRTQADSIRARLHIDPTGWRPTAENLTMLPIVQDALARDRKLAFNYTRADGQSSSRTVEPLGIVCKLTTWYLIARGPTGIRTFKVSRMENAVALAVGFERPKNFDLAAYWKRSTAALGEQRKRVTATLALDPTAFQAFHGWCSMTPAPNHPAAAAIPADWKIYTIEFESYDPPPQSSANPSPGTNLSS